MILGPADKIFPYNGLTLNLYRSKTLRKLLNRTYTALLRLEKQGFIPRPMFTAGNHRYYTMYELQAVVELNYTIGIPYKFTPGTEYKWVTELASRWGEIRQYFLEGQMPPMPLHIQFTSEMDLKEYLRSMLRSAGVTSDVFVERMTERFLERASIT